MDVKIQANNEAGTMALNKAIKHSKSLAARAVARVTLVKEDPLVVSFTALAISKLPNSVLRMPAIKNTVNMAVVQMMAEYGCKEKDYKVLWNG